MPYSMQLTEQVPNDPPRMGAKSTTTSNHPSTSADRVDALRVLLLKEFQFLTPTFKKLFL